jgi:ankyrin repeat protein
MEINIAIELDDYQQLKKLIATQDDKEYALLRAADNGKMKLVKYLLRKGAKNTTAALKLAVFRKYEAIAMLLMNNGADMYSQDGMLVSLAAAYGCIDLLKFFVHKGAEVDDHNLSIACANGHIEVVKYIHSLGVSVNPVNWRGTAINLIKYAATNKKGLEIVKFLHSNGADIHLDNDAAFIKACEFGMLDTAKYLFAHGANINANFGSPLIQAAQHGEFNTVCFLLKNGATNSMDFCATLACDNKHFDICKLFIAYGVKMNSNKLLEKYILFSDKMTEKRRVKAANTIGTWWIPICYDLSRESGKRMMERSWTRYEKMCEQQGLIFN